MQLTVKRFNSVSCLCRISIKILAHLYFAFCILWHSTYEGHFKCWRRCNVGESWRVGEFCGRLVQFERQEAYSRIFAPNSTNLIICCYFTAFVLICIDVLRMLFSWMWGSRLRGAIVINKFPHTSQCQLALQGIGNYSSSSFNLHRRDKFQFVVYNTSQILDFLLILILTFE